MRNNQDRLGPPSATEDQSVAGASLSYAVPTEFVELPSKGKFYAENHPLHNQETIEIRYMTAKEEDILASVALIKKGLAVDRLLENIIVPDVNPKTLLIGDRNAVMIAARISAYGSAYVANVVCTKCLEAQDHTFDLKKVNYNLACFDDNLLTKYDISFNKEKIRFDYVLPKSSVKVGVKIPTGFDEVVEEAVGENSAITALLSKIIVSVNENENPSEVSSFVDSMLAWDSRELRTVLPLMSPNVDLKQEFGCRSCGEEDIREIPLTAEFFWPR